MERVAALAALVVLVGACVGCRAARSVGSPGSEEPAVAAARKTAPQRPAPQAPAPAALPAPENPWFPPQDWSERRDAEDFRIGVLQGRSDDDAHRALQEVCEGLVQGTVAAAALAPDRVQGLSELLSAQIEGGGRPSEYRIGRLERVSDAAAWARVRFAGERGWSEGEAFLVRILDRWFVSDLQVNLSMARPRQAGSFVPSPYRDKTE